MPTQVQSRRGTTAEHSTFTGANGELTVDTTKKTVVVHDGTTAGGAPLLRENGSQNAVTTGTSTAASFIPTSSTVPINGVYLPAANTVGIASNSTGRLLVDSSGRLLVGTSSAATGFGNLQSHTTGAFAGFYGNFSDDTNPVVLTLGKSRGNNFTTIVQSGDGVGSLRFNATDGTGNLIRAAQINCEVDGTPGTNDMPGRLVFSTTADGASSPTERLRITNAGRIGLGQTAPATTVDVNGAQSANVTAVAALNIDCSLGNTFTKTINANSTFTVSNVPASRSYAFTLELTHTSGTITWFSGVVWPGGTAPTLTTGKVHLFMFFTDDGGTTWRASSLINY